APPPAPPGAPPRAPRRWRGLLLDRWLGRLLHRLLDIALGLPLPILEDGGKLGVRRQRLGRRLRRRLAPRRRAWRWGRGPGRGGRRRRASAALRRRRREVFGRRQEHQLVRLWLLPGRGRRW